MRQSQGFTLIELMITLAVLAVIIGIATPSFTATIRENQLTAISHELHAGLQFARSEAIKRRQTVTVCRRNADGTACANGADWAPGWLVISNGTVLKVWDAVQGATLAGPQNGVSFQASGMSGASSTFLVSHSACSGQQRRQVAVAITGITTLSKVNCT